MHLYLCIQMIMKLVEKFEQKIENDESILSIFVSIPEAVKAETV